MHIYFIYFRSPRLIQTFENSKFGGGVCFVSFLGSVPILIALYLRGY
jgi:hypothetical protein